MDFDRELLGAEGGSWPLSAQLYSPSKALGLYDPLLFVVRLDPELRSQLVGSSGVYSLNQTDPAVVRAFSTYLHEIIHWWQHIGSTVGFILTLSTPVQAHINNPHLQSILNSIGPKKSLRSFYLRHLQSMSKPLYGSFNIVLNNWHDIEFSRHLLLSQKAASKWVLEDPFFDSVGHSYHMAWMSFILLLSTSVDPEFVVLPDCRKWHDGFQVLTKNKIPGFFPDSAVVGLPLGAKEIFEGQARFSQLHFLHFASGRSLDFPQFSSRGMLGQVYMDAFDLFLSVLETPRPSSIDHPLVGLFLLLCDLAINPTDGFPFDILNFESFIHDVDPGWRFYLLARAIADKHPDLVGAIRNYSAEEYKAIAEMLCAAVGCLPPYSAMEMVSGWPNRSVGFSKLMDESELYSFEGANLPIRVLLSRFISFQLDKMKHPEYFVWPGAHCVEGRSQSPLTEVVSILNRNAPLFLDAPDGEVRPNLLGGRFSEQTVYKTFDAYYEWVVYFNLVKQWTVEDGPFSMEVVKKITRKYSNDHLYKWYSKRFHDIHGVFLEDFEIV